MSSAELTFGVEMEFICIFTDGAFEGVWETDPNVTDAVYLLLEERGVPTWSPRVNLDLEPAASKCQKWQIGFDFCYLSEDERVYLHGGHKEECIEMSSRKFNFFRDDWRGEIQTVLGVLRFIEQKYHCRFITNVTTGLHVHVGNDTQKIPLRTAKNVFELGTAFERCFDELHTVPRAIYHNHPAPRVEYHHDRVVYHHHRLHALCCLPPSGFFQYDATVPGPRTCLFDRLADIEELRSYEELGGFFRKPLILPGPEPHAYTGHNSAYNFDNLCRMTELDTEEQLTGTIEFRQHNGSLDHMEIVSWVQVVCQMVKFCSSVSSEEMVNLCVNASSPTYGIRDLLKQIGCPNQLVDHRIAPEDEQATIGVLSDRFEDLTHQRVDDDPMEDLIEQNDTEEATHVDRAALVAGIREKYELGLYGLKPNIPDISNVSMETRGMFRSYLNLNTVATPYASEEERDSWVRARVFRQIAWRYVRNRNSGFAMRRVV